MPAKTKRFELRAHEWHSADYVHEWIARDITRDDTRRPIIREALAKLPFKRNDPIQVLDVGAGYGIFSEEVLKAFPKATVTLQDYSRAMLAQSRRRLRRYAARTEFVQGDLTGRSWTAAVGGPFDLAVSALVIHNLADAAEIAACYRAIQSVLKPGGCFLDYDHFKYAGGLVDNVDALKRGKFARVNCLWQNGPSAVLQAIKIAA